ncbi:hypothetical protein [Aeromonas dhakensis]|uniref:hypothetical protein n=1 Tax=Aeromonas dhakensis TaxID=196024 RepID=UPI001B36DAB9|nr:hypothetical protein [Aeromonas dhakensis]MBQ4680435.1 hypothetical protein [Aeromonas dhakensis]
MNHYEKISYEKSYVAFIDVLGFKNMVFNSDETTINKYFEVVNNSLSELKNIQLKKPIKSIIISDSIILSVPLLGDIESDLDRLLHLCIAIAKLQQNLAINNIWVRGAITTGDTYFNEEKHQVVGPAFVNAYLLEENSAIYPRVILDSKIIKKFSFQSATSFIEKMNKIDVGGLSYSNWCDNILYNWTNPNGKPITRIKQDTPLFIDYLSNISQQNDHGCLIKIIGHLEKNLYQSVSTYSKYRWVTDYLISLSDREQENGNPFSSEVLYRLTSL